MSQTAAARRGPPTRRTAVLVALLAVAAVLVPVLVYRWLAPGAPSLLAIELAGSASDIRRLAGENQGGYLRALAASFVFVAGHGSALMAGAWLAHRLSSTAVTRQLARGAKVAAAVAVLSGIGVKAMLLLVIGGAVDWDGCAVAAQAFAFTRWSLVLPAAVVAVVGAGTALRRGIRQRPPHTIPVISLFGEDAAPRTNPDGTGPGCRAAWRDHSKVPNHQPPPEGSAEIGICVSGGGIRSATFALGALDAMRNVLTRARWLVAVSGGGYAAGAMQLAMQRCRDDSGSAPAATPADVYCAGSVELAYTRLHGRYLADGAREWLAVAVTVLRGFLVNMLTLGLLVFVCGRLLAHGYAEIPVDLLMLTRDSWAPQPGVLWAVGVLASGWLFLSTVSVLAEAAHEKLARWLRGPAAWALGCACVAGLAGAGLPALAWVFREPISGTVALGSPSVSLVAGYLAALIALFKQPSIRAAMSKQMKNGYARLRTASAGSRNLLATIGVYLGLLALLAGFVMFFGATLAHTRSAGATSGWPGHPPEWEITAGCAALLVLLVWIDQVRWSLHPFYRRRLASAFAVRRVREHGHVTAKPYDYYTETTDLAGYGARPEGGGFPEVIFCCAAHVAAADAPPGRRVAPWTMSAEFVGGQLHGWIPTAALQGAVSRTLQGDLTVQAAQAISGAALASQMGVEQRAYTKFLTLTNIRLGSWLPNPAYLGVAPSWARPLLPQRRRLPTLAREFGGVFCTESPLVFVTDGGHYENLGLVELLRRRPKLVYCVDASADRGGVPRTLAAAIELAREELGVEITFPDAADLVPGSGTPDPDESHDQLMTPLKDRIAPASVITGSITYPDLGDPYRGGTGTIVVGKAVLTASAPFPLLAYASNHLSFPSDNTSDQWFDASQFDAYHSLGRHIGSIMLEKLPPSEISGEPGPHPGPHPGELPDSLLPLTSEILSGHAAPQPASR